MTHVVLGQLKCMMASFLSVTIYGKCMMPGGLKICKILNQTLKVV